MHRFFKSFNWLSKNWRWERKLRLNPQLTPGFSLPHPLPCVLSWLNAGHSWWHEKCDSGYSVSVLGDGVSESYVSARPGSYYTPLGMLLVQSDSTEWHHLVRSFSYVITLRSPHSHCVCVFFRQGGHMFNESILVSLEVTRRDCQQTNRCHFKYTIIHMV